MKIIKLLIFSYILYLVTFLTACSPQPVCCADDFSRATEIQLRHRVLLELNEAIDNKNKTQLLNLFGKRQQKKLQQTLETQNGFEQLQNTYQPLLKYHLQYERPIGKKLWLLVYIAPTDKKQHFRFMLWRDKDRYRIFSAKSVLKK